jgi:outer membrane protein insertion porin family
MIEAIKFNGLVYLSPETAMDMIGLHEGQEVDMEKVDEAVRILFHQQYFDDIVIEEDNGTLIITVKEKPIIAKVDFVGIGENDKDSINSFTSVKKGEIYDQTKIEFAKEQLKKFYELKGFFDTVIDVETNNLNEKSLEVKFLINRGENIIIKDVNIYGAKKLKYKDFEPYISNKEREFMGWMWGRNDGKINLFELEADSAKIKDIYYKYGYLDANISSPYLRVYFDNYNAKLEYKVEEGEKYKIGNIAIDIPNMPEDFIDTNKTLRLFTLQKKDTFNVIKLRQDVKYLENTIADMGYAYVKIYPDIKKDEQNHTVDVIYTIITGDKVYIRDVRITGNTITIDRVIRRDVFLAPRDLYNRTDLAESRNALRRTSYFEDVTIKEERVSKDEIDLIVEVKERQTGAIGGGIGYGSSDGFLINAYVSETNLFGSGVSTSINVERSKKELSGSIAVTNPRIFDSAYSISGSVYRRDFDYYDYDELSTGFYIGLGRKLGRYVSTSIKYTYEQSELSDLTESLKYDKSGLLEKSIKSSVTPSISFDNTDDYYLPRRGMAATTSLEIAGVGGDQKFLKSITKFAKFYGLEDTIGYDLILRYKAQFGWIKENGYLPYNEKFYLGGVSSLRGFESNSIAPKNNNDSLTGGKISFLNSVELSFPLVDRIKMRGALFFDYGMIGEKSFDEKRASAGIGIEWMSPMGPIQFVFAKPLIKKDGDRASTFEFTMGRQF